VQSPVDEFDRHRRGVTTRSARPPSLQGRTSVPEIPELPELLLERARGGDAAARGRLLDSYRNYLRLLARAQMGQGLHARLEPSDLVQEALLEADRDFAAFAGGSEKELLVWLRRILVRNLMDAARHHGAQARDRQREASLEALMEESSNALG